MTFTPANELERLALKIWRDREMAYPDHLAFARRMTPDDMDMASGTWAIVLQQAQRQLQEQGREQAADLFEPPSL